MDAEPPRAAKLGQHRATLRPGFGFPVLAVDQRVRSTLPTKPALPAWSSEPAPNSAASVHAPLEPVSVP